MMLKNKIIFVSGGTGYLGQAICRRCAAYGAKVLFSFHEKKTKADELMKGIEGSTAIQINLKNIGDIKEKIRQVHKNFESVDILINNAAVSQIMPFSMLEEEDIDFLLDVNVKGAVFLTKELVRKMIRKKQGAIINIGSIAGSRILDVPVHYALSKAALSGFTYSLAAELKRFNIRVNSVIPGLLEDGVSRGVPEDLKNDFIKHCTVGRAGTGEEVAEVVCFLSSDRASYVNGQNIAVDGGI